MHHYQRNGTEQHYAAYLAVSFALLILHVRQQRYPLSDLNAFYVLRDGNLSSTG